MMDRIRAWHLLISAIRNWVPADKQQERLEALGYFEKLEADIKRVRELHYETVNGTCAACISALWTNDHGMHLFHTKYPCETIEALDGEQ